MIIYKIENKINNKLYIGQTKNSLEFRIREHLKVCSLIGRALRKYKLESFVMSIIDSAEDRVTLHEKEKYWIKTLNTKHPNGYNLTIGGEGVASSQKPPKTNGKTVALIIRNAPENFRRDLQTLAKLEGKSMQKLMLEIIKKEMERANGTNQTVLV